MQLTKEQVQSFVEINKGIPEFDKCSEEEKIEIANGVANYYLTLFKIYHTLEKKD